MTQLKQTPSQTVGPYFAYGLCPQQYNYDLKSLFTPVLAEPEVPGTHITIIGNVFDGEGKAVADAMIEMVQADASGRYVESPSEARQSGFRGFARCGTGTDAQARFVIETVKPGRVDAQSAPHVDVIVLMRGMLVHAFTRLYFDDEAAANAADPVLAQVPAERRTTLVAKRVQGVSNPTYRFDIHMQGSQETVFFDL
ncbi:protocatechuate 3,4-dioxygenase subunit alpha [Pararobbsia silviterrae]|uniref:Protocatechuate 3,4-dioxygenase subunit alpha n=1 Tax=Pararobbsia silviterrae TaxID=1792498 RepID=A0A494XZJ5_9BURK|nr:protocatechuate 3,4-dioxygenase subunit alpha [Pararobbsia silviterrae]RKP55935.1 protocatechuate 3,4-dioxygenase subunit alpha [Pararobbsia silviterrae]